MATTREMRLFTMAFLSLLGCGLALPGFAYDGGSGAPKNAKSAADDHRPHWRFEGKPSRTGKRVGLAVIADFSDFRLEDWSGSGINSVAKLRSQLERMQEHWSFVSRGRERFEWNIIRISLPVARKADAYADGGAYRDAVANLILKEIDVAKYDRNKDGVVDTAWIVASSGDANYPYLVGGASKNGGVNMFVDGQADDSIVAGATGNFNHEAGHTIGLRDIYGDYGTLGYLTFMDDSWPVPPQDLSAFERVTLGWSNPEIIRENREGVRLKSALNSFDAVKVPTIRDEEYFLIEYRRRPDSGFGSSAPAYDGLAVYHVLEGSSQRQDPPLIKFEAADGYIAPNTSPQFNDFLYPGNPDMRAPLAVRSYFDGQNALEIRNVRWGGGDSLAFDVAIFRASTRNLLANPSFELGTGAAPDAWQANAYNPSAAFLWDNRTARQGRRSVRISATQPNDASVIQNVTNLIAGKNYELCGWVKGDGVTTDPASAPVGANVSLMGGFDQSQSLSGAFDWSQLCLAFKAQSDNATVACRLGFYGSVVTGQIWCDAMSLEGLNSAFSAPVASGR